LSYGTIKRQWGFSYISTKKGKERAASADVGFMFIAYNIRRIINIVGKNALKKYLEVLILSISGIYHPIRFKLNPFKAINFLNKILTTFFERILNRLIFGYYLIRTGAFYTDCRCTQAERSQTHISHIWFLPTRKAIAKKPKEPNFSQRSTEIEF